MNKAKNSHFHKGAKAAKSAKAARDGIESKKIQSKKIESKILKNSQNSQNSPKTPKLRILGGKWKGRSLLMADLATTRSTKAILKESLFSSIASDLARAIFVEFFAGSGSIGLEALSRGASGAIFFEKDKKAASVLEKNILALCGENAINYGGRGDQKCGDLGDLIESKILDSIQIYKGDTFSLAPSVFAKFSRQNASKAAPDSINVIESGVKNIAQMPQNAEFIAYFDPPFSIRENYSQIYQKCFLLCENLLKTQNNFILLIFEHESAFVMPSEISNYSLVKCRKFGASALSYYVKKNQ